MKIDELHTRHYLSDNGKIIVHKIREDNNNGTESIWLGRFDDISNYEEIDKPEKKEDA